MLTIACSSSDGRFCAVLDSGKLIWTSGWSFLNVVETTKKIRRMIRISTNETIMMVGALRLRTMKFIAWGAPSVSHYWRRRRLCCQRRRFCRHHFAGGAPIVAFADQLDDKSFHFHRHHFHFLREITEGDQSRHRDRKSEHGCIQRFGNAERDLTRIRCARAQTKMRKNVNQTRDRTDQTDQWRDPGDHFENDEPFLQANHFVAGARFHHFHVLRTWSAQVLERHPRDPRERWLSVMHDP